MRRLVRVSFFLSCVIPFHLNSPLTEDSSDEDEDDIIGKRLLQVPRENLSSLTCRTGFSRDEVRRLYRAFKQQVCIALLFFFFSVEINLLLYSGKKLNAVRNEKVHS